MRPWWRAAPEQARWVMVDVESSGLDPHADRLLAIGALGLQVDWAARRLAIRIADSFDVVVRQDLPSERGNILVHGIGRARQAAGVPAADAVAAFGAFVAAAPLLAFHAAFDRALLARQLRLGNPWVDLAQLCEVTHPEVGARALDEWLDHFGLACPARHQAVVDALVEAELLLRIWPRIARECGSWRDVQRLAAHRKWLR